MQERELIRQIRQNTENHPEERIIEIEMERLRDFRNHPFRIRDDRAMKELMESIERYGILNPLIVRPLPEGVYEIISGHRRKYAAKMLGYRKVPVIIRVMTTDEAVIRMVDSNLQRQQICHSEKALAIKMKYDAMKRTPGNRKSGPDGHDDDSIRGKRTVQIVGEAFGNSPKQIQRYLKIAELIPEILEKLDAGEISFNPAYEVAFLEQMEQRMLLEAMKFVQSAPSISQAQRIKKLSQEGTLTLEAMKVILEEVKKGEINRVMFKNEQLYQYFPRNYSPERMRQEILEMLEERRIQKQRQPEKEEEPGAETVNTGPAGQHERKERRN